METICRAPWSLGLSTASNGTLESLVPRVRELRGTHLRAVVARLTSIAKRGMTTGARSYDRG